MNVSNRVVKSARFPAGREEIYNSVVYKIVIYGLFLFLKVAGIFVFTLTEVISVLLICWS